MNNPPLLTQFYLPPFSLICTSDIEYSISIVVDYCYSIMEEVLSQKNANTWDTLCYPIQIAENQLQRIWSPVEHLHSVCNTAELRQIYQKNKKIILEYEIWVSQNYYLYFAYYNLQNSNYYLTLTLPQKKFVINNLRQFKLSGIELSNSKKKRYQEICKILSTLTSIYDNNVLDSTESWKKLILDKSRLCGYPKYALDIAELEAKSCGKNGWLLTLKFPVYLSVMKYCEDNSLREEIYWAYHTRASDQGPDAGCWDNTAIIDEILSLRCELAKLLGFNSYANKVLTHRMLKTSDQVLYFLKSLSTFIISYAKKVFVNLEQFSKRYYGCKKLYPWDMLFYIEKQKNFFCSLSEEELRYFFSVNRVLLGMFAIVNSIYGIKVYERYDVDIWHPDVRFFDIFDIYNQRLGGFYLDIYARANKYSGAWMDVFVEMMYGLHNMKQKPIAYLICNFVPVREGEYIFLSHDDVSTLFHEFGHVLHHVMTIIDIPGISGTSGVSLDAVEVPSQFMEKFCWDVQVLQTFAIHYLTGESLSIRSINQLLRLRRYQLSFSLLYQLVYSIFDIHIHHMSYFVGRHVQFMQVFNDIKKQLLIFPSVEWERFPHTFNHIFSSDYAAGYYSYLWSDMLASDIWFFFKEKGVLNYHSGKFFLDQILSRGGSEDFFDLFYRFRGREAQTKCLLRYYYGEI